MPALADTPTCGLFGGWRDRIEFRLDRQDRRIDRLEDRFGWGGPGINFGGGYGGPGIGFGGGGPPLINQPIIENPITNPGPSQPIFQPPAFPSQPIYQPPVAPVQPIYQPPVPIQLPAQPIYEQPVAPVQPIYTPPVGVQPIWAPPAIPQWQGFSPFVPPGIGAQPFSLDLSLRNNQGWGGWGGRMWEDTRRAPPARPAGGTMPPAPGARLSPPVALQAAGGRYGAPPNGYMRLTNQWR